MNIARFSPKLINGMTWIARLLSMVISIAIVTCFAVITKEFSYEYQYWIVLSILLAFPLTSLIAWRWHVIGGLLVITISISAICVSLLFITSMVRILIYTLIHSRVWDIFTLILLGFGTTNLVLGFLHVAVGWWKRQTT